MLIREQPDGAALCIGQASHAWVSGQLARAWAPQPDEPVCLAAEQHDVGMATWDLRPRSTKPPADPWPSWTWPWPTTSRCGAPPRRNCSLRVANAALLVSLHGTRLYGMGDLDAMESGGADAVREFLAAQGALQERLAHEVAPRPGSCVRRSRPRTLRDRSRGRRYR